MQHLISYDLARGMHIIAVIAWISGMLVLPRFYATISCLPAGDVGEQVLLKSAQHIRAIILTPFMVLAWSFGLFLFAAYFATDWEEPVARLHAVPFWFWAKFALALTLTAYHGLLVSAGRRFARGERPLSERFWDVMSWAPFFIAVFIVLLATLEPGRSDLSF